ncbi:MAG: type II secretion system F family protein [Halobacteriales archaeon]|nr:type II secretion system F family protein [Halobacteriales archaeon]
MSLADSSLGDDDLLSDIGYPVYSRLFDRDGDFVGDMRQTLAKARIPDPVDLYLSRSITIGLFTGVVLWLVGSLLGWSLFAFGVLPETLLGIPFYNETVVAIIEAVKVPLIILLTGIVFGWLGFMFGFGMMVLIPYSKAGERKREINLLLPDAVSFMYALGVGGLNQLEIIEAMARAEDTYGEVAREFKTIVQETQYFDTDYRTAIRQQSLETPSDELSQFLTDMLSIINSGGDIESFLDDKKDKHMRTAKQEQETILETLELFGEMYMTLSLFPLLLIIVLVIMSMLGEADQDLLFMTVYGLIPMTGVGFLVLISTVKQDDPGDGFLKFRSSDRRETGDGQGLFSLGTVEGFVGEWDVFDRIKRQEGSYRVQEIVGAPHIFFRDNPLYTLALTVPISLVVLAVAFVQGVIQPTFDSMVAAPVGSTFFWLYVPLYITLVPLTVFYEWNVISRQGVVKTLSDNLRKLSSANDTGMTLLDSIRMVADTSTGRLATELDIIYSKVQYGTSLNDALIEFNNKYHIPRLARTVKLISKAQEASSQITEVLTTAAQASENQDDIDRDRISRTRMQVVIILMTYFTLLAVMAILKTQFLDVMAGLTDQSGGGGGAGGFGGSLDTQLLSLLFFHAVTAQAILSGFISGYIRDGTLLSGLKYIVVLMTVALATWIVVG